MTGAGRPPMAGAERADQGHASACLPAADAPPDDPLLLLRQPAEADVDLI